MIEVKNVVQNSAGDNLLIIKADSAGVLVAGSLGVSDNNISVDATGNVSFSGELTAAPGVFDGKTPVEPPVNSNEDLQDLILARMGRFSKGIDKVLESIGVTQFMGDYTPLFTQMLTKCEDAYQNDPWKISR